MISRQQWNAFSDDEKWEYLFHHSRAMEEAVQNLGNAIEFVREQTAKLEVNPATSYKS